MLQLPIPVICPLLACGVHYRQANHRCTICDLPTLRTETDAWSRKRMWPMGSLQLLLSAGIWPRLAAMLLRCAQVLDEVGAVSTPEPFLRLASHRA